MSQKGEVRSPAAVIVLSFVTCGIYALVWTYNVTNEIKNYLVKEDINPGLDVLLCIVCFPYYIYWLYKVAKLIAEMQAKAGLPVQDDSTLYIVLAVFGVGFVCPAMIQTKLNEIWAK